MEVHHHSHTESHSIKHTEKKIKHYFFEFFMLFLAVFCGFLAENFREHRVELHREKQFMKSLLYDLQKDSMSLAENIESAPRTIRFSDSLLIELKKEPLQGREKRLYAFLSLVYEGTNIRYYDRTITQLRNAGAFRLIQKQNVSDALLDYDIQMKEAAAYQGSLAFWSFASPGISKAASIFNIRLVFEIQAAARKYIQHLDSIPFPEQPKLLTYNDRDIMEFINMQSFGHSGDEINYDYAVNMYKKNRTLDSLIKKEYHLQ